MLALSAVAIMFHSYFIALQVFVCALQLFSDTTTGAMTMRLTHTCAIRYRLRIDQILGGTALAIVATQMLLAVVPAIRILKSL